LATKLGPNPKDSLGIKKVSITKLPMVGIAHGSHAMMYGADKYGPYNWRDNAVIASIYIDATMRHLMAWFDQKEELAQDSGVHHLGHVLANMAILLDAQETGNLIDDRPHSGKAAEVLARLNDVVAKRRDRANGSPNPSVDAPVGSSEPSSVQGLLSGAHSVVPS
jgi:hypothetical protein